jgi:serine/threonine protein kinase
MVTPAAISALKDYHIEGVIAQGSYGTVLKAFSKSSGACFAVKVLGQEAEMALGANGRGLIESEILLASSVTHSSILACKEVLHVGDSHYLIMDYMPNGTMLDRVNHMGGLPEQECWSCFRQIASGVEYLHKTMNVCHRDIKLENIMFDDDFNCKIIDFGLSRILAGDGELMATRCGSLSYASPEMLTHGGYTMSTDIWSLGVALYAMVTGRLPFRSTNQASLIAEIMESEFALPSTTNPLIENLLRRMLDKNPKTRFTIAQVMSHPWVGGGSDKSLGINLYSCAAASLPSLHIETGRKEQKHASHGVEKSVHFGDFLALARGGLLVDEVGQARKRGGTFIHTLPRVRQRVVQRRESSGVLVG